MQVLLDVIAGYPLGLSHTREWQVAGVIRSSRSQP